MSFFVRRFNRDYDYLQANKLSSLQGEVLFLIISTCRIDERDRIASLSGGREASHCFEDFGWEEEPTSGEINKKKDVSHMLT